MRFLILTQYYPPEIGAPQVRLAAFARELKRRGHTTEVITAFPHHLLGRIYPNYRHRMYCNEIVDGIKVHRTWVYAASGTGGKRLLNYFSFAAASILPLLLSKKVDFLFVESPPLFLGITGCIYSLIRRAPMIFNVSDLWPDSVRALGVLSDGTAYRSALRLERWIYKSSQFVSATTEGMMRTLAFEKQVPAERLLFLPNGVDTELFHPCSSDRALAKQLNLDLKNIIIYAGTHGAAQGLDVILDTAKLLANLDIAFLLVGGGHTKPSLQSRARALRLSNVVFLDPQPLEMMPRLFSLATASIVPLVKRPLFQGARPSKIFPSIACGVPVIFSGEGEAASLIRVNDIGLVVPPEDPQALAHAVTALCTQKRERALMSANARRLALSKFGWDTIVSAWLNQLEQRIEARRLSRNLV